MPILIRRISRTQWPTTFTTQEDDVSADAITNCLRTYTNALSFWEIANNSDLIKAIIALVSGPKQEKFSGIHVVSIDTNNPLLSELTVVPSLGDTTIVPLKEDHRDITNLTYNKIGIIKKLILEALINNRYNNYTKSEVKQIVQDAITRGVISISDLSPKLVETEKLK